MEIRTVTVRKGISIQLFANVLYLALKLRKNKRYRNRRWWVHPIFQKRSTQGHFLTLFQDLKTDSEKFFRYTRMDQTAFYILLDKIESKLKKRSRRQYICPEQRLAITLRFVS